MPPLAAAYHMPPCQDSICNTIWLTIPTHTRTCIHMRTCSRRRQHLAPAWGSLHLRQPLPCPRLVMFPPSSPVPLPDLGHIPPLVSFPAASPLAVPTKRPEHPRLPQRRSATSSIPRPAMHLIEMATSICFWGCFKDCRVEQKVWGCLVDLRRHRPLRTKQTLRLTLATVTDAIGQGPPVKKVISHNSSYFWLIE